ncbi:hypothetical protein COLO4_36151 [Corchorus olitorius]|uniref:Transmembrane protein n=1 Tax=Corchorus olitorius TaxID=93759 RepID=A0A1R3GAZ7_9ROSI|nr:hypothetical protein COLO4_36151 [Corchorus olitorius]
MKNSSINFTAFFALFLLQIFFIMSSNSLSLCHGEVIIPPGERNHIPRKLLVSSMATFPAAGHNSKLNGAMKEPKKAVEPSLRKAPPSVPNPTQN